MECLTCDCPAGCEVIRLQWRDRAGLAPAYSAPSMCSGPYAGTGPGVNRPIRSGDDDHMSVRLTLLCHAPTSATRLAAFPLDEPIEVRELDHAVPRRVDIARCGPERRCTDTASALGLGHEVDPGLADLDSGSWAGISLAEVERDDPGGLLAWLTDPAAIPHGGESLLALVSRVAEWLNRLPDGRITGITHPSVIRAAVVHALGAPPESFWRLDVGPLSYTELSGSAGRWTVRETGHRLRRGSR